MEPQPGTPGNNYDFIVNPVKPQKKAFFSISGKDPFVTKLIVLVGGAVVLIVVLAFVVNLFFGGKNNLDALVEIAQREQEIVRLSDRGEDASSQAIKNSAINTQLTVKSHQLKWLAFLATKDRTLKPEELSLKKDATTDTKLLTAEQTSTFDTTYAAVMRSQLEAYAAALKSARNGTSNKQERALQDAQYKDVQLLLKQWPSPTLGLASY